MTKYIKPTCKVLDDAWIKSLDKNRPPTRQSWADPSLPSFYVTQQPSGKISFCIRYEFDRIPDKWTIGSYSKISLKEARAAARQGFADVRANINPKLGKHEGSDQPGWNLVKNVVRRWADAAAKGTVEKKALDPKTLENYLGAISMYFSAVEWPEGSRRVPGKGKFGPRTIQSISKAEITKARDDAFRAAPSQARTLMKALRGVFKHACAEGLIEVERNPAHWVALGRPDATRSRLLKPSELRVILAAAETLLPKWRAVVEMILLTGKRRSEVQHSPRSEWGFMAGVWAIPPARVKTRRADYVPIIQRMRDIIATVPRVGVPTPDEKLFGGWGHVGAKRSLDKAIIAILARERGLTPTKEMTLQTFGFAPWTWHDLRRTANHNWKRLGIPHDIREAMLNHVKDKLTEAYDPDRHVPLKREAYERWAARIEEIRAGLVPDEDAIYEDVDWESDPDEDMEEAA